MDPLRLPSIQLPGSIDLPRPSIEEPVFPAPSHPLLIPPSVPPKKPPKPKPPPQGIDQSARDAAKRLQEQVRQLNDNIQAQQETIDLLVNPPVIEAIEVQAPPTATLPGTSLEFALPSPEVVTVAATTAAAAAAASVGATLAAQNLVKVLKPAFQTALKKLAKLRGKDPETFGRRRLRLRRSKE